MGSERAGREGRGRRLVSWLAGSPPPGPGAQAITAAATPLRVGRDKILPQNAAWQAEVWAYYDDLAEFGYGVDWLSEMVSRVRLLAAAAPAGDGDEPSPVDLDDPDPRQDVGAAREVAGMVAELAGGTGGQAQMLGQLTVQLSVPGEGWLIGETRAPTEAPVWEVRSTDELRTARTGTQAGVGVEVIDEHASAGGMLRWRPLAPDSMVVRVWRPHPRFRHQADSPARHARGVMRELELANRRIQADYLSRLASAGVWLLPEELTFPASPQYADEPDPFVAEWVDTASTAIATPGTAAATVPIPLRVPAELIEPLSRGFLDFTTKQDDEVLAKRESAIKRLATSLDLPAEVLLGISDLNHWSAWVVSDNGLTQHIAPVVELICQCLTVGYLWPRLAAAGVERPEGWLVWYDPSELTVRPDRSDDAIAAYDRLELSGDALRRETGFSESDAPDAEELRRLVLLKMAADPNQATAALVELGLLQAPAAPPAPGAGGPSGEADDQPATRPEESPRSGQDQEDRQPPPAPARPGRPPAPAGPAARVNGHKRARGATRGQ